MTITMKTKIGMESLTIRLHHGRRCSECSGQRRQIDGGWYGWLRRHGDLVAVWYPSDLILKRPSAGCRDPKPMVCGYGDTEHRLHGWRRCGQCVRRSNDDVHRWHLTTCRRTAARCGVFSDGRGLWKIWFTRWMTRWVKSEISWENGVI